MVPTTQPVTPLETEPRRPRLGFLGVGWIGLRRMHAILESGAGEIVALADPNPEQLARGVELAPDAEQLPGLNQLLELDLDGIVIATPSALHAEQTIAALSRRRAVFCQKPLGRDAHEVRAMVEASRRADRLLGVDLSYRYSEGLEKIRALIRSGALGEIFHAELEFHNAFGPQSPWFYNAQLSGGGCVIDLGIHLADAALWILDDEVVEVSSRLYADGRRLACGSSTIEDFATARLDLASGAVVELACSWRVHAGTDAVIGATFHGTRGGARWHNLGGSFHDFEAAHFRGTSTEILAHPPDAWSGRASVAWTKRLAASARFDPEIERQIEVANVLDAIYQRTPATLQQAHCGA